MESHHATTWSLGLIAPFTSSEDLSTESNEHFRYPALPTHRSIRLIKLGDCKDYPFSLSLHVASLDQAPEYVALSYTWGDPASPYLDQISPIPSTSVKILCDNQSFWVGPNLAAALDRLRILLEDVPDTYLWIDAVSINQADDLEKASQVKMMAQIYATAKLVYAWLGPKDSSSEEFLHILKQISSIHPNTLAKCKGSVDFQYHHRYVKQFGILPIPLDSWYSWGALYSRPYFQRCWVIQECVHAREVLFLLGDSSFRLQDLSKAILYLTELKWKQYIEPATLNTIRESSISPRYEIPAKYKRMVESHMAVSGHADMMTNLPMARFFLIRRELDHSANSKLKLILQRHRGAQATDPRDKIFAMISLISDSFHPYASKIELENLVDYVIPSGKSREWTCKTLYGEITWAFLQAEQPLDILSEKEDASLTKLEGLASWIPDWTTNLMSRWLMPSTKRPWNATRNLVAKIHRRGACLHLRGRRLATVVQTSALPQKLSVNSTARFRSFAEVVQGLPLMTPLGISRLELFCRTCLLDDCNGASPISQHEIYGYLTFCIRHLSRVWYFQEKVGSDADLDFEVVQMEPPRKRLRDLFRKTKGLPEDFSNPLTLPWLELIQSEKSISLIDLSTLSAYLKHVGYKQGERLHPSLDMDVIFERFGQAMANRRLVRTDNMMLGIGPQSTGEGDELWLLAGGRTPYFMRRKENGNYQFLGEGYAHGVMFGEQAIEEQLVDLIIE